MAKQRKRGRPSRKEDEPQTKGSSVRIDAELSTRIGYIIAARRVRGENHIDKASYVDSLIRDQVNREFEQEKRQMKADD